MAVRSGRAKRLCKVSLKVFKSEDFFKLKQENRVGEGVAEDSATSNRLRIIAV